MTINNKWCITKRLEHYWVELFSTILSSLHRAYIGAFAAFTASSLMMLISIFAIIGIHKKYAKFLVSFYFCMTNKAKYNTNFYHSVLSFGKCRTENPSSVCWLEGWSQWIQRVLTNTQGMQTWNGNLLPDERSTVM